LLRLGPTFFYGFFLLGAAPIEITLAWFQGWRHSDNELFYRPTVEGLLYIFAFIAAAETIFRLSHNEKSVKDNPHLLLNKAICLGIFLIFGIFYLADDRGTVLEKNHIDYFGQSIQVLVSLFAVAASYTTFHITHKKPNRKPNVGKQPVA
jgi:uncharacterized protein (DUF486 family)